MLKLHATLKFNLKLYFMLHFQRYLSNDLSTSLMHEDKNYRTKMQYTIINFRTHLNGQLTLLQKIELRGKNQALASFPTNYLLGAN